MRKITKRRGPWEVGVEVLDAGRRRYLCVTIDPYAVHVRQKGCRRGYSLPWAAVYQLGARAEADFKARVKREARAACKGGRR